MENKIPYANTPHPLTGVNNAKLAMWLFVASEVMLFGALFASYAVLRATSVTWPDATQLLNLSVGWLLSFILLASGVCLYGASVLYRRGEAKTADLYVWLCLISALMFLGLKAWVYYQKIQLGFVPSTSNFWGLYYLLTGVHSLHIVAGIVFLALRMGVSAGKAEKGQWLEVFCHLLVVCRWGLDANIYIDLFEVTVIFSLFCAVCFGDPDSTMAQSANSGILTLLLTTAGVFGSGVGFFIYRRRQTTFGE